MADRKSTANNPLHEPGDPRETLSNCQHVLQYVRLHPVDDDDEESIDGQSIVLNAVIRALDGLADELAGRKPLEVVRG